jgi:hypothetical protein
MPKNRTVTKESTPESGRLIYDLVVTLMEAYQALPVQDQEGPLGEQIHGVMHTAQRYLMGSKERARCTS